MLTAACPLSSSQSQPTKATLKAAYRLLGYAKRHPDHVLSFHPSDMILRVYSDASYLNRPNSGSTAGGYHYLGTTDPAFHNGPVFCHCTRIPVVCAAVSEAEYAGLFANAQVCVDERRILRSLGYPQPPTVIWCDNECAIGLASETVRPKKSKSIDMRFDWIIDRVRQHQFKIQFCSGILNRSDFFTKPLSVQGHVAAMPWFASTPTTPPPLPPVSPVPALEAALSTSAASRFLSDTGATHVLLRRGALPSLRSIFTPRPLPSLEFSLPNGARLPVDGNDAGVLSFPSKTTPVPCYICDDDTLAHNLVGASPLIGPDGHAIYTSTSVDFYSPASPTPFLSGSKLRDEDLWSLNL